MRKLVLCLCGILIFSACVGGSASSGELLTRAHRYVFAASVSGDKVTVTSVAIAMATARLVDAKCEAGKGIERKFVTFLNDHHVPTSAYGDPNTLEGSKREMYLREGTRDWEFDKSEYCRVFLDLYRNGVAGNIATEF